MLTKAPDTEEGARVFAYVCSACHLGGYNQVRAERTLQEAVLRQNGMLAADAIEYQVINGKNRMPAFENRLLNHAPQQLIVPRGLRKYDLSGRTLDLGHSGQMRTRCFARHDLNVSCPHL